MNAILCLGLFCSSLRFLSKSRRCAKKQWLFFQRVGLGRVGLKLCFNFVCERQSERAEWQQQYFSNLRFIHFKRTDSGKRESGKDKMIEKNHDSHWRKRKREREREMSQKLKLWNRMCAISVKHSKKHSTHTQWERGFGPFLLLPFQFGKEDKCESKRPAQWIFPRSYCNLIGFKGCLIRSLNKLPRNSIGNTTVRASIYIIILW